MRKIVLVLIALLLTACSQSIDFHDEQTRCIERTHERFLGAEYRDKEIVWDRNPCEYPFKFRHTKDGFPVFGRE